MIKKRSCAPCVEGLEPRQLFAAMPTPAHVLIVVEENKAFSQIIGSSDDPYINSLASSAAVFTDSHGISHPSQPNYLSLFSGSTQGVTDSGFYTFDAPNLAQQLIAKGLSFGGYSEDLPSVGSEVNSQGKYVRRHNPWAQFTNIPSTVNMPLTSFPTDFSQLPTVSFVVPNLDDDMHDGTIPQGDTWLQQHLGAYTTWAKNNNSLFIYTMDEDDMSTPTNQIATFIYGANVVPGNYSETINHFSVLRTIEDMFGLAPIANAATATPITDIWQPSGAAQPPQITLMQDVDHVHIDWTFNGVTQPQATIADPAGLTLSSTTNTAINLDYTNGVPLPNKLNLNGIFTLNNLATTGNPLANTTIDLAGSTLFVSYASPTTDPLALVRGYLQTGYNNGTWTGTSPNGAIRSSTAAANPNQTTAIGYVDSADNLIAGLPLNTIELSYTLYGNTGLQGGSYAVGFTDFMRLTQHYVGTGMAWDRGDFNYDGVVDSNDFTLLSKTYGMTLPPPPAPTQVPAPLQTPIVTTTDSSTKPKRVTTIKRKLAPLAM